MTDHTYKCAACNGDVDPGKTGLLRGLLIHNNSIPQEYRGYAIDAIHYIDHCKSPDKIKVLPSPSLAATE